MVFDKNNQKENTAFPANFHRPYFVFLDQLDTCISRVREHCYCVISPWSWSLKQQGAPHVHGIYVCTREKELYTHVQNLARVCWANPCVLAEE